VTAAEHHAVPALETASIAFELLGGTTLGVSILSTAITAQGQPVATGPSRESVSIRLPTSKQTKCAMDAAKQSANAN
jgi:hypothetical protein